MTIEEKRESLPSVSGVPWHKHSAGSHVSRIPMAVRFPLLLLPRLVIGRCSATRVAAYAAALAECGHRGLAHWCWNQAIRLANDEWTCDRILRLCIDTGELDTTAKLAKQYYDESGMMPAEAVRLTGMLVLNNGFGAALEIYDRLLQRSGEDLVASWPAPSWPHPPNVFDLRANLERARSSDKGTARTSLYCEVARLCFSFEAFETSANLFKRVEAVKDLDGVDRIAFAYSLLRSGDEQLPQLRHLVGGSSACESADPDWLVLLASVQFAFGATDSAAAMVDRALRIRFKACHDLEQITSDCRHIIACISGCSDRLKFTELPAAATYRDGVGLRKIFICGNGWSGSGALYDALSEYEGFAEAPDTPVDRYVNQCTGNEMMLVQGSAGLGQTWRKAKKDLVLTKFDLWELFRCHVLGGGAIGFTEHKGAKTAADFLSRMGSRYTGMFRHLFESVAALPAGATMNELRIALTSMTEAFSSAIAGDSGETRILFNNAVFGSNIDMLEIFSNFRAAVVVRDPLDQFVDRRNQDLKQWMTVNRFVHVYRDSRLAFSARRKELQPDHASEIREVEFERFVLDQKYRQDVLDWLLEGGTARHTRQRFDPECSARNIGIHAALATRREYSVMNSALKHWRRS